LSTSSTAFANIIWDGANEDVQPDDDFNPL